jgi:hypothetical protein
VGVKPLVGVVLLVLRFRLFGRKVSQLHRAPFRSGDIRCDLEIVKTGGLPEIIKSGRHVHAGAGDGRRYQESREASAPEQIKPMLR